MAPQQDIPVAANVLGTIGTVLWCVQTIPQIWTNWRTKKTEGLPGSMMYLWALCGVPFGAYNIVQRFNVPLQVQPQAFMALCLVNWCQVLLYSSKWAIRKVLLIGIANAAAFAGVQAALIPLYDAGNGTGILVVGIFANILLAAGLLPPYGEIWKRRGRVVGINFVFLSMDWLGAFFSLMSLAAQNSFDVLGGVLYIVWKDAAARGKTFDDIAAEHEERGLPFKFAERKSSKHTKNTDEEAGTVRRDVDSSDSQAGDTVIVAAPVGNAEYAYRKTSVSKAEAGKKTESVAHETVDR
ncbi:hypothetical protein AAE478_009187 [Parahypoxylon ruwenzoriense]